MKKHCCEMMDYHVNNSCDQHPDRYDCPDMLIAYSERLDEYGLIIHDGRGSWITIQFCPWCGSKLGSVVTTKYS